MKSQISKPHTNVVTVEPQCTSRRIGFGEMLKAITVIGLFAIVLGFAGPMAHAAVTNGGFESVTTSPPGPFLNVLPTNWQCIATYPDSCSSGVGVFAKGTADILNTSPFYVYSPFPSQSPALGNFLGVDPCYGQSPGAACLPAHGSAAVYQNLGVLAPGNYVVNFWQAAGQWYSFTGATTSHWEVGLGNTCLNSLCGSFVGEIEYSQAMVNSPGGNGTTGTYVPWELQTLHFTIPSSAASTPEFLSFVALGDIAVPPIVLLDGVNLQPVPEPGTLLLLGTNLVGVGVAALRRRAKLRSVGPDREDVSGS